MVRDITLWASLLLACLCANACADVIEITDSNFQQLREGEWLIKFYAPWCPACQQFTAPWISIDRKFKEAGRNVKVAKVDVTENTILNGRFLIQHLPTLYHAKNDEYRKYEGRRTQEEVEAYVVEEQWKKTEPLPWLSSPMGPTGIVFGYAMVGGEYLQKTYVMLTTKYGAPVWLVIVCAAMTVITVGVLLGLVLVFCISIFNRQYVEPAQERPPVASDPNFGSTGDNDEVDRKKGSAGASKPSPKPSAAAAKDSSITTSPKQRKGKKMKASAE